MKVQYMIRTLEKVISILKVYENQNLQQMLDDIYVKVSSTQKQAAQSKPSPKHEIDVSSITNSLNKMNKEEMSAFLNQFKKEDLLSIGQCINIALQTKDKKAVLIERIANHYGYICLNKQMAHRNQKEFHTP